MPSHLLPEDPEGAGHNGEGSGDNLEQQRESDHVIPGLPGRPCHHVHVHWLHAETAHTHTHTESWGMGESEINTTYMYMYM